MLELDSQSDTQSRQSSLVVDVVRAVGGFAAVIILGHAGKLNSEAIERCIWLVSLGQGLPSLITAGQVVLRKGK